MSVLSYFIMRALLLSKKVKWAALKLKIKRWQNSVRTERHPANELFDLSMYLYVERNTNLDNSILILWYEFQSKFSSFLFLEKLKKNSIAVWHSIWSLDSDSKFRRILFFFSRGSNEEQKGSLQMKAFLGVQFFKITARFS